MNSTSLTPLEVAELLKITKNTVYELIKRGELPAYKVGRKLRIDKEDIDNYIKTCKYYNNNSLYLEINATDKNNKVITYKIPLELKNNCPK